MSPTLRSFVCGFVLASVLISNDSVAGGVINGDFESGLTGWTTTPGDWTTLEVTGGNHIAITQTSGELNQVFELPAGAQTIEFDFLFDSSGTVGNPFGDSATFFLEDPATGDALIPPVPGLEAFPLFYNETSEGLVSFRSDYVTVTSGSGADPDHISLIVSHLPASQFVDLTFQLSDLNNNNVDSFLVIDNVSVTVPEPATCILVLSASLGVFRRRR